MAILRLASRNLMTAANRNALLLKKNSPIAKSSSTAIRSMGSSSGDHDDHHHEHLVFEPPFNPVVIGGWILFVVGGGFGTMVWAFRHQQYKQGFWK